MRMLHLSLIIALMASVSAFAADPDYSVFRSQVREMPRRIFAYHFRERHVDLHLPQSGYVDTLDPKYRDAIRDKFIHDMNAFTDSDADANGSRLGPGVYASGNPVQSWSFGGDNFSLYAVPIRKGAHYFDVRKDSKVPFTSAQKALLKDYGCSKDSLRGLVSAGSGDCREFVIGLVKALNVSVIVYDWDHPREIPECPVPNTVAFNLIGEDGVDWPRFRYLTRESAPIYAVDSAAEDRTVINEYLVQAWYKPAWSVTQTNNAPKVDAKAWIRENIYTCTGKPEDMPRK